MPLALTMKKKYILVLRDNFKVNIDIYEKLFKETGVSDLPLGFDLRFSFAASKPEGAVHLRFVRGKKKEEDALIWETQVQSVGASLPREKDQIVDWGVEAHKLTDSWFFKMIEGELLRRFE